MPKFKKYDYESDNQAEKRIDKNKAKALLKKLKKKRKGRKKRGPYGKNSSYAISEE